MNNEKTGMLIAQIRKEKGLTQKQLADRIEKRKYIIGSLLLLLQYYISSSVLFQKNGNTRGLYGWLIAFLEWLRNMYLRNKYATSKDK